MSATQKAEKQFVDPWDKMFVAYRAETQQREMTEDAKKIAQQQNEFYRKYGVSADSWRLVRSLSLLGKSGSLRTRNGNTQKGKWVISIGLSSRIVSGFGEICQVGEIWG